MNDQFKKQQQAQLAQATMMSRFKKSLEYQLIKNTFEIKGLIWKREREKLMKTQSSRETSFYFIGKEDAVGDLLESIDQIIADGDAIRQANELTAKYQEEQ